MGKIFASIILSFIIILIINLSWFSINLYYFAIDGFQTLFVANTFVENVYLSTYLKWILLLDLSYWICVIIFILTRKNYKTDSELYHLINTPIKNPKICVIIPTFNEEKNIEFVINDYKNQDFVNEIIIIDNHSTDKTVEIARKCNVSVFTKDSNKGFAHSCVVGMKESIKTDSDLVVFTECDGTFSGADIKKMIPYMENCDMVVGTRLIQVLTEKGNQNSILHVWGNYFLAKLLQLKYFSLFNLSIIELTDVGCMHRCIKKTALEKIINKFTSPNSDEIIISSNSGLFAILMTMIGIENNLRIVEIPITFKKRLGISKTKADKKSHAIRYGLNFFWYILTH
ncbi:glycosyltransferase [Candidatus Nitrosopelagicus sp.]|nr:glycosyltransferase [Candidatus Nitrosopelagicus sp.]